MSAGFPADLNTRRYADIAQSPTEEALLTRKPQHRTLSILLSLLASTPAVAQDATTNPTIASDWLISVGTAFTENDPKIGLAPDGARVTLIDLEALGIDPDDNDYYVAATWQAPRRWRLDFTTYVSKLDGGLFTDKDYTYGDLVIPAGSGLAMDLSSRFYVLNAHYSFWKKPRWEAGAGFGIYALDWAGGLALVNGDSGEVLGQETEDFLAPLPTLGLFARYAFTERLAGRVGVDWLSANIDKYDGEVFALSAGLDWWFSQHWGLSAGLDIVDIDVTVDDEPFNQYVNASWDSLYVKLNLAF